MKPVWHIDGNDVVGLQGRSPDFVRVVNGLLARQAVGAVPDGAVHLNVKDTEPDGGVDAAVDLPVPGDPTGFLGVPTCWQYKAQRRGNIKPKNGGGQEAALREEIRKPYAESDLLPISWSSHNGGHLFVDSVDSGSGRFSSIGTYLTQVAENSAGVL